MCEMKVRITKIEECIGGISICVQYAEALYEFDMNIKKLHIGDIIELEAEREEE